MRNIRLIIEYDGTNYNGWQVQKNLPTVQAAIAGTIRDCLNENVAVHGAGRTDSGVHALGQTANFFTRSKMPASTLLKALNAHLPKDIAIQKLDEVSENFHSQYSAKIKIYRYFLYIGRSRPAVNRNFCVTLRRKPDLKSMKKAAKLLLGTHDFRAFGTKTADDKNTVRTLYNITISKRGQYLVTDVKGNGFLYNMVRTIMGTLLLVGEGKIPPEDVKNILNSRNRCKAGPTAPAKGLFLQKIIY
ncbi:MAG: tRNA pseudouridine(38-40) synthase TruA [Planctomycetes bacterium]|nr:tRNA pseudouridine(38-40) synthase TruA [Planctomycetota bacterium]